MILLEKFFRDDIASHTLNTLVLSRCRVPAPKPLAPKESYSIPTIAFEDGRDKLPAHNPGVLI
jgi:hypothetical protein